MFLKSSYKLKPKFKIRNLIVNSYPSRKNPHIKVLIQVGFNFVQDGGGMHVDCLGLWLIGVFFSLTTACNIRAASVICFVYTFYLYMVKANGLHANWQLASWPRAHKVLVCRTDTSPHPHLDLHGANMQ